MTRILVTGGMGMLGHALAARLATEFSTGVTVRDANRDDPDYPCAAVTRYPNIDLTCDDALTRTLDAEPWEVVVNAAGIVRQRPEASDPVRVITTNALLPHRLAAACQARGIRLIHFSTDCVFSGSCDAPRGPRGYRETDPPDPDDLYGRSKLMGEPVGPGCLTLRASIIGHELRGHHGLLGWFLRQRGAVNGYTRALFTGITTPVAAKLLARLVRNHPGLEGLWHVAAEPISKHDLLHLVREHAGSTTEILPDSSVVCDRRLDGRAFHHATGWLAPAWPDMVAELVAQ